MVKILIDEPENDAVLGFDQYRDALIGLIMDSDPQFTIGIFGGWGSGKTTLMNIMYRKLEDTYKEDVVPVWFNAWRYEREQYSAIVPLLGTLACVVLEREELKSFRETLIRVLKCIVKSIELNFGIAGFKPEEMVNEAKELKTITGSKVIYYDLLKFIDEALKKIREGRFQNDKKELRFVVFIDDLDRCAPDKVREVFESIKVLLGMRGIIYVLGLSPETVEKFLDVKEAGISGVDYVKKFFQIPFRLPEWSIDDIDKYLGHLLGKLDMYKDVFIDEGNRKLIIKGLEKNPREVKRFINSYILTMEAFKDSKLDPRILLMLQLIQFKPIWSNFYRDIFNIEGLLDDIKNYLDNKNSENLKYKEYIDKMDRDLIELLKLAKDVLPITRDELEKYRRAGMTIAPIKETPSPIGEVTNEFLLKLLETGNIIEFNRIRNDNPRFIPSFLGAILEGADLREAKLEGADLKGADLKGARLYDADLSEANLEGAILEGAYLAKTRLREAKLEGADLKGADLLMANLRGADLKGADLKGARLWGAILEKANLTGAKLDKVRRLESAHFDEETMTHSIDIDLDTLKNLPDNIIKKIILRDNPSLQSKLT